MVKERFFFPCLVMLDIVYTIVLFMAEKNEYIYSKFTFSFKSFVINTCALVCVNLVLISIYILYRKKLLKLFFVGGFVVLISAWLLSAIYAFTALGVFWQSETRDYTKFRRVDEHLDSQLSVAGLKISDIIQMDIEKVDNFYYWSQSQLGCENFAFKAELHLSNQGYEELKFAFSNAKEFKQKTFSMQEQEELNMTGYYELDMEALLNESTTTVDSWNTMIINFCDTQRIIILDWRGCCYT